MKKLFNKNIDAVVTFFYPVAAGIETNMLETYSVLVQKGWAVNVHTTQSTLTQKNVLPAKNSIRGIAINRYPKQLLGFFPSLQWQTGNIIAIHNFDIFPHVFILSKALIRKLLGLPTPFIFLTPHGGFTPDWDSFSKVPAFIKKLYHRTLGTWLINVSVDQVRAVSEWEKQQIIAYGVNPKIITVISNGMEKEAYERNSKNVSSEIQKQVKSWGTYLLQIGRIYPIKNYETTIRALTQLPKHINFVIVGPTADHKYLKLLKLLIEKHKLTHRVFFAGVIRGSNKYYVIKNARLMIHMARWESFCNAVHEGMSQGLPVIVANNTALPLLVKNKVNGFCVSTFDSKTLAQKINYVLRNYNTREIKEMRETNRQFGLKRSWSEVATQIETLLLRLVAKKNQCLPSLRGSASGGDEAISTPKRLLRYTPACRQTGHFTRNDN